MPNFRWIRFAHPPSQTSCLFVFSLPLSLRMDPGRGGIFDRGRISIPAPPYKLCGHSKSNSGLVLLLEVSDQTTIPKDTYKGNLVFPTKNLGGKNYIMALLVAGNFGIPMKGPIESSENTTGWLAPGESKELNMHYSVPNGFKLSKLIFPGILESNIVVETN